MDNGKEMKGVNKNGWEISATDVKNIVMSVLANM